MVRIGGGVPNLPKDLDHPLGDVVTSQPHKTYGGVVQYDLGKNVWWDHFERRIGRLRQRLLMSRSVVSGVWRPPLIRH